MAVLTIVVLILVGFTTKWEETENTTMVEGESNPPASIGRIIVMAAAARSIAILTPSRRPP